VREGISFYAGENDLGHKEDKRRRMNAWLAAHPATLAGRTGELTELATPALAGGATPGRPSITERERALGRVDSAMGCRRAALAAVL